MNRDAVIYALGVGACGKDAVDADELKYVYHENGQQFIQVYFIIIFFSFLGLRSGFIFAFRFLFWALSHQSQI